MGIAYNTSIIRDGLVLHLDAANPKSYPGSGNTWFDLSGNGNDGTLDNYNNTPNYLTDFLGCFDFSNSSRFYIDIPQLNNTNPYTVMWFGIDGAGDQYSGVSRDVDWRVGNHLIGWQTGAINSDSGRDTNNNISGDEFMICHVNDTSTNTVSQYLNSLFYGNFTYSNWTSVLRWSVGCRGDGDNHQYLGKISKIQIYNRALAPLEIKQNYNALKGRYGI